MAHQSKIEERTLAFTDVKSVQHLSKDHATQRKIGWVVAGVLIALVVVAIVVGISIAHAD